MSGRTDILTALITLVSGVTGLTDAGRVQRGIPDETALMGGPCAFIAIPTVGGRDDDQLGSFRRSASVRIVVATPAADGVTARDLAIDTLMDAIVAAIESDRVLSAVSSVPIVALVFESYDVAAGDEIHPSLSQQALGLIGLRIEYITTSGMGF